MTKPAIEIGGLGRFQRQLKKMGYEDLPDTFKAIHLKAAELVAESAASRVPTRSGRLRQSIRAAGQAKAAVIRMGSKKVPYAGFIDFGGTINFKTKKGQITRPFVKGGRYLFPAADAKRKQVIDMYTEAVDEVVKDFNNES